MQNEPPYRIKAGANLVVVRVVVRDSQGNPVENLRKEDFKLFDRGKEQSIAQFAVESSATVSSSPTRSGAHTPGQPATPPPVAMPGRFLAFYFDDLNMSDTDMMQVRAAADRYLAGNLQLNDRVAIFTSTQMLCGFTADPKQIHDALLKLHVSRVSIRQCPDISDYQAQEITDTGGNPADDAMKIAVDEAVRQCHMSETNALQVIPAMAKSIVDGAQILARTSLQGLERMVQYMSEMPGERTIVLVSPGFPSRSEQRQLDRIIGRALRSQVVISSLDPKGLALLMRAADVTRAYAPGGPLMLAQQTLDSAREAVATDVLAEVAEGTGGEFFHNNNDLKAGFGALTGSATCYILGFTPTDMKPDGKFHALRVTLTEKQKGTSIQARRGYFAPASEAEADAEAKENKAFDAEAEAQEQIGEAILSKAEMAASRPWPTLRNSLAIEPKAVRSAVAEGCILCAERYLAHGNGAEAVKLYDEVRAADLPQTRILEATRGAILARGAEGVPLLVKELQSADKQHFALGLSVARETSRPGGDRGRGGRVGPRRRRNGNRC